MDFLSLLMSIPSLMHDFSGAETAPYQPQQEQLAANQSALAAAQTDPNNPLYKKIYGQYQDQNKQNLAQVIAESQGQNRLNSGMGRTPLFSQERGGEGLFRQLMQGYQGMGVQSDQQARQALTAAAGGTQQALGSYNAITPTTAKANAQQLSGYQGIYDLLKGQTPQHVGSMGAGNYGNNGSGGYPTFNNPATQGINWNAYAG